MNGVDNYLLYVGSSDFGRDYDVYLRKGGAQLGWVTKDRYGTGWTADDGEGHVVGASTRWEATTRMWPRRRLA